MFTSIDDFIKSWETEASLTLKIFSAIPDDAIAKSVNDLVRTPGRLAWHITQTLTEMPHKAGVLETDDLDGLPVPATMQELSATYQKYSDALISALKTKWSGTDLDEKIEIYGQQWAKSTLLSVQINHQIHHRGQLTVVMRLLGLKVPGIYGPAREEWGQFGMEAQE